MKYIFPLFLLLCSLNLVSQSVFFKTGVNRTSYDYTNSLNKKNLNIQSSSGSFYEIGYIFPIKAKKYGQVSKLNLYTSLNIDQFNATGGNTMDNYEWNTSYLGLKSNIRYTVFGIDDFVELALKGGVSLHKILNGKQKIGGNTYSLIDNDEFNSLMFSPNIGLDFTFGLYDDVFLNIGLDFSKVTSLSRNGDQSKDPIVIVNKESLSFNNTQIGFGLTINL